MSLLTSLLIAFALAMDCFAISVSVGVCNKSVDMKRLLFMAFMVGLFQALMPVIGWICSVFFGSETASWAKYIAAALLFGVGGKMIYDTLRHNDDSDEMEKCYNLTFIVVLGLAVATSIDALAVGASFGIMRYDILQPVVIIGIVSFVLSIVGNFIGSTIGNKLSNKAEIVGGLILVSLAVKTLL